MPEGLTSPALLHHGAKAYGVRGHVWICGRVAAGMRLEFGSSSQSVQVGRLLNAIGWNPHKPARRACKRHEAAIARWHTDPRAGPQKGAQAQSHTILFLDESVVDPLPSVGRTDAAVGHTPSTTVVTRCLSGHRATECLPTLLGVILGDGLVLPTPLRPGQNVADRLGYGQHESPPQPPPLGHAPWEARPRLALNAASGLACGGDCRLFWHMSTAIVPARIMVSRANAPMASVRCRYQAVQLRTSS